MKTTHTSLAHRTHPSSVPEGHRKLERFKNWPGRVVARWMARSERHAKGGAGGHSRSEALSRGVSHGARSAPSTGHRTALAWLGAILLSMTLGLSDAAAYSRIFTLWLENGTSAPVSFTIRAVSCWDGTGSQFYAPYFDADGKVVLGPVAPGQKISITVARTQGHGCDGENGSFTITPSNSTEAQGFGFDNGGILWTFHANRFVGELSVKSTADESYTWTLKPLEARLSGPVDARLTLPRSPIAYDSGWWARVDEASTARVKTIRFANQPGFQGSRYDSCGQSDPFGGFELFHEQHVVRLPNKNGRAYFMGRVPGAITDIFT